MALLFECDDVIRDKLNSVFASSPNEGLARG